MQGLEHVTAVPTVLHYNLKYLSTIVTILLILTSVPDILSYLELYITSLLIMFINRNILLLFLFFKGYCIHLFPDTMFAFNYNVTSPF